MSPNGGRPDPDRAQSSPGRQRILASVSGLGPAELEATLVGWGEPRFRAGQILDWVHRRSVFSPDDMTDLPAALRRRLARELPIVASRVTDWRPSPDRTEKALVELSDGHRIEAVLIPEGERTTLCISTQVGCAVGCTFCASGVGGIVRNLTTSEIVDQFLHARARLAAAGRTLTNLVVMGMGEPLHNTEALLAALAILGAERGGAFGARRITISTAGVVRGIERLAAERASWGLALSLHAPDDDLRRRLIPHRGIGTVAEVLSAGRDYAATRNRRVTVEYVLLAGVNDRPTDALSLATRLAGTRFHVNLIPHNPVEGLPHRAPAAADVARFATLLEEAGLAITVRRQRGDDIAAACGQLRLLSSD